MEVRAREAGQASRLLSKGGTPRVLLLNPPGQRNYARDFFLGAEVEKELLAPPQDLVLLSAALPSSWEPSVIDAVAEGLGDKTSLDRARALRPDAVVFQTSGASYEEDSAFLSKLKAALPQAKFVGIGDIYRDIKEMAFALHPFLDALIMDPSAAPVADYLKGAGGAPFENLIYRGGNRLVSGPERHYHGVWNMPLPRWSLFPLRSYRLPLGLEGPCSSLQTDFGCPFLCTYCPMSAMAHKHREIESVIAEARGLHELGVKSVFFRDQSFGVHESRMLRLLDRFIEEGFGFSWAATTRVDLVSQRLLEKMKEAGCAAVCFGIDSGDDEILRGSKKHSSVAQAEAALKLARRAGLKTWGTFILGLPIDTRESVERTLRAASRLDLDHRSFRVDPLRYASAYRRDMLVRGLVPPESLPPDTPTTSSVWQGRMGISNPDVFHYFHQVSAGKKAPAHAR